MHLTFCGGTGSVTGANFLLEAAGKKLLIDCGLEQGIMDHSKDPNYVAFPYNPAEIDVLLVTHAHIDHIGRIPKLVKEGFRGKIVSTSATQDLVGYMLRDAYRIMRGEAERYGLQPLYEPNNIDEALSMWETLEYYSKKELVSGVVVNLKNAGHILGSAIIEIEAEGKKIVFTGDLGNSPTPLLPDTDIVEGAHFMVTESVYGDRNHEMANVRRMRMKEAILKVLKRKGTLIIPTFSLEKTQVLLHELNELIETEQVPSVPVFLDSPLAIDITGVYKNYTNLFKKEVQDQIASGDDIFHFPKLSLTRAPEDSEIIDHTESPKIILAGSGMSGGGRILRHEKNYLPFEQNAVLITGYQTLGTLGRKIKDGVKKVEIDGQPIKIRAEIIEISGYSSHKDSDHLVEFISHTADTLKKVFCAMGEPKSARFLAQRIRNELNIEAVVPELSDRVELN